MNAGKQSNVIAFPLERSRERAPIRTVQLRDGKFVIARAPVASTAILQERLEPIEDRPPLHL
jgi:hypothetical protein